MIKEEESLGHAWYTVTLCMTAYVFSIIDRQIVTLLIEPIRSDLHISDTQFSLVQGLSFALFYALMGIPIARLADSRSRSLIIAAGIFTWSLATMVCGLTRTFWQLFLARMAVGCGEAALSPATYSIISDSFPRSRLGLALGVYSVGAFIGSGLAYLIGGTVIDMLSNLGPVTLPVIGVTRPWQLTFFIVGAPGILLALVFAITVRDPERKGDTQDQLYSIRQVGDYVWTHKASFFSHYLGFSFLSLSVFAFLFWLPAFMFRSYGLSPGEAGRYLGLLVLISSPAGTLFSGWLIDKFSQRGLVDSPMRVGILGGLGATVPAALFSFMPTLASTLALLAIAMFFASFPMAAAAAGVQVMAPNRMRAQLTALFFLALNIIGITGGASLVALCTDYLFAREDFVGHSMSLVCTLASLTGATILACGLRFCRVTVDAVNSQPGSQ